MKFQLAFAALLSFAAASAAAAAAAAASDEVPYVIATRNLGDIGTLTVYGINATSGSQKPTLQTRQCGDRSVSCSGGHAATRSVCNTLINQVCTSGTALSNSPRSICLSQSGSQCCISWSGDVGAISESALCGAAQNVANECSGNALSGLQRNTPLGGGCVSECVSNRATGCS